MVLELKVPHSDDLASLKVMLPVFMSYLLSLIFIGIYWNNHHHMLQAAKHISGAIMWANLHLLFWLSLVPFASGWMGENHFTTWPVAVYGAVLCMAGVAYFILARSLVKLHGKNSTLARAMAKDKRASFPLLSMLLVLLSAFLMRVCKFCHLCDCRCNMIFT